MKHKIGEKVKVYGSARMSDAAKFRVAKIVDYKWNLVFVEFCDGETEREWVDCRLIKPMESSHHDTLTT